MKEKQGIKEKTVVLLGFLSGRWKKNETFTFFDIIKHCGTKIISAETRIIRYLVEKGLLTEEKVPIQTATQKRNRTTFTIVTDDGDLLCDTLDSYVAKYHRHAKKEKKKLLVKRGAVKEAVDKRKEWSKGSGLEDEALLLAKIKSLVQENENLKFELSDAKEDMDRLVEQKEELEGKLVKASNGVKFCPDCGLNLKKWAETARDIIAKCRQA